MPAPSDEPDYYDVLHVSREAPLEIIRASYRTLMQKLKNHPDLGGDAETAANINEAYAVLGNPERRSEYDARFDMIERIAKGVPESPPAEPVAQPARILDPFRECVFCAAPHAHGKVVDSDACCDTCSSPLSVAQNFRFESFGQRAVARIDKRQAVTFYTHWPQGVAHSGDTEDISLNGLRLVTRYGLRKGQRLKIVTNVLEAVASVSHCRFERRRWTTRCVAGVSFETLRFVQSVGGFVSRRV